MGFAQVGCARGTDLGLSERRLEVSFRFLIPPGLWHLWDIPWDLSPPSASGHLCPFAQSRDSKREQPRGPSYVPIRPGGGGEGGAIWYAEKRTWDPTDETLSRFSRSRDIRTARGRHNAQWWGFFWADCGLSSRL